MSTSSQAQKGFKTFLLTLVISLVVFSAVYYVINSGVDSEAEYQNTASEVTRTQTREEYPAEDVEKANKVETATLGESTSKNVFQELTDSKPDVIPKQVLAGSDVAGDDEEDDDVLESTVPDTGVIGPTSGILLSVALMGTAALLIFIGPRKLALSSFEKRTLKDLD